MQVGNFFFQTFFVCYSTPYEGPHNFFYNIFPIKKYPFFWYGPPTSGQDQTDRQHGLSGYFVTY